MPTFNHPARAATARSKDDKSDDAVALLQAAHGTPAEQHRDD
jgi:hypothetical protein